MLRKSVALLIPFLAGCVSFDNAALNCEIVSFIGNPATLSGPVRLDPGLEAELRPQLPSAFQQTAFCWYISNDILVASDKKSASLSSTGFTFKREQGKWVVTDLPAPMLKPPEFIQ
jgi:hypothetical protein